MKILFVTSAFWPDLGGVEKHTGETSRGIEDMGHEVTVLTEDSSSAIKKEESWQGINIYRFSYPHIKILGLLNIWIELFKRRQLIKEADVIHIHDVFIWYLPFRFLYPNKKIITTFHGWEGKWPIPIKYILLKKLAWKLSSRSVAIGKYIEKYYGIKADKIMYGGSVRINKKFKKKRNKVVYVGRLDTDTGISAFLKDLDNYEYRDVTFVGDGMLRKKCQKYGKVTGFTDPRPYLKSAEYAVPGGYLSYIEAKSYGCKIVTYADNPLKEDYWKEIKKVKKFPTWEQIAEEYLDLYQSMK